MQGPPTCAGHSKQCSDPLQSSEGADNPAKQEPTAEDPASLNKNSPAGGGARRGRGYRGGGGNKSSSMCGEAVTCEYCDDVSFTTVCVAFRCLSRQQHMVEATTGPISVSSNRDGQSQLSTQLHSTSQQRRNKGVVRLPSRTLTKVTHSGSNLGS
jgi:hypothetical protein